MANRSCRQAKPKQSPYWMEAAAAWQLESALTQHRFVRSHSHPTVNTLSQVNTTSPFAFTHAIVCFGAIGLIESKDENQSGSNQESFGSVRRGPAATTASFSTSDLITHRIGSSASSGYSGPAVAAHIGPVE